MEMTPSPDSTAPEAKAKPSPEIIAAASRIVEDFTNCCMGLPDSASDLLIGLIVAEMMELPATRQESGEEGGGEWSTDDFMPKVDGRSFKCSCGCNVFRKRGTQYKCNACEMIYESE